MDIHFRAARHAVLIFKSWCLELSFWVLQTKAVIKVAMGDPKARLKALKIASGVLGKDNSR